MQERDEVRMGFRSYLDDVQLIQAGPSVRERLERWITAQHHKAVIRRLRRLREHLEREMVPEPWATSEVPLVLLLSNVCIALNLDDHERAKVLGQLGERALAELLETRPIPQPKTLLNPRQAKARAYVRQNGSIKLSAYRELCPGWSDETLRLDLADLVRRGLLTKNGAKKGTYYTAGADAGSPVKKGGDAIEP